MNPQASIPRVFWNLHILWLLADKNCAESTNTLTDSYRYKQSTAITQTAKLEMPSTEQLSDSAPVPPATAGGQPRVFLACSILFDPSLQLVLNFLLSALSSPILGYTGEAFSIWTIHVFQSVISQGYSSHPGNSARAVECDNPACNICCRRLRT